MEQLSDCLDYFSRDKLMIGSTLDVCYLCRQ